MPRTKTATRQGRSDRVVLTAKEYVDSRVEGLDAKMDGLRSEFIGLRSEFAGLRSEFAGLNAKMDAVLHVVTPTLAAVHQLSSDVAIIKDLLAPRKPIGFRKDEPA